MSATVEPRLTKIEKYLDSALNHLGVAQGCTDKQYQMRQVMHIFECLDEAMTEVNIILINNEMPFFKRTTTVNTDGKVTSVTKAVAPVIIEGQYSEVKEVPVIALPDLSKDQPLIEDY